MRTQRIKTKGILFLVIFFIGFTTTYAQLLHPGISHKQSDLDRMKYMVESGKSPWIETYEKLRRNSDASYNYKVKGNSNNTTITNHSDFINDGFAAYHNALMWNITGDVRHAQKCVEIFNAWVNIRRIEDQFALNNGRGPWKMLEGAEIIKSSYDGWPQSDINKFKAMLVYPGWSGTRAPTSAIRSKDVTFYWNIYQGDRIRHGNQGLFAYRSLMAMGIFMDNEIMYDRALRYLRGQSHRSDDLAYPSGPPNTSSTNTGCEYYDEFRINSHGNTEDYGYNEVMSNYIYENGQGQESSRDQAHSLGGISITATMCEIAWNQGDDLYGHLDNRLLLGWEYNFRYNLSFVKSFPDQTSPWEPTIASGEYIKRTDRTGRWKGLKINPYLACNDKTNNFLNRGKHLLEGVYEMSLGHYKDRMQLNASKYKWTERSFDYLKDNIGFEDGSHAVDHPGWGGLKFHRVSPGDPIRGFSSNGLPNYAMNIIPGTIEAEDYDYFPLNGEDKTYHDTSTGNAGNEYRTDDVDVEICSEGGYNLGYLENEEWVTYTVYISETGTYDINVRYAGITGNGAIQFDFDNSDKTGVVAIPATGGSQVWDDFMVKEGVLLSQGVQRMRINISGARHAFNINKFSITASSACAVSQTGVSPSNLASEIDYDYYEGTWNALPDFESETILRSGTSAAIDLDNGERANAFGYVFDGYIDLETEGDYTFYTKSDDGSRLYIDDTRIVENDGLHGNIEKSGTVCLAAGYHKIKVEYFDKSGGTALSVSYEGPGISKQILSNLYHLEGTLDVDSQELTGVSIYPNPVKDILNIKRKTASEGTIKLINALGQVQLSKTIQEQSSILNVSSLSSGIYFLKIETQEGILVKKIIND